MAAIRQIGPCILIGHSQGGGLAAHAANKAGDLVHACVFLEPHGAPATFDSAAIAGKPCLTVDGDYLDRDAFWRDLTARSAAMRREWARAGGIADHCNLVARGLYGNSHMMMDRNSDAVLEQVISWLNHCAEKGVLS